MQEMEEKLTRAKMIEKMREKMREMTHDEFEEYLDTLVGNCGQKTGCRWTVETEEMEKALFCNP